MSDERISREEFNVKAKALYEEMWKTLKTLCERHDAIDGVTLYALAGVFGGFLRASTKGLPEREAVEMFIGLMNSVVQHAELPIALGGFGSMTAQKFNEIRERALRESEARDVPTPGHMTAEQKRKLN